MNSNIENDTLLQQLQKALKSQSVEEKLELRAIEIQLDIMAQVSTLLEERKMSRKEFADKMGKSKSFISQLFSADKMLNLKMIAQIQDIFQVKFESSFTAFADLKKKQNFSIEDFDDCVDCTEQQPYIFTLAPKTAKAA